MEEKHLLEEDNLWYFIHYSTSI